jgi:hypothetical protein
LFLTISEMMNLWFDHYFTSVTRKILDWQRWQVDLRRPFFHILKWANVHFSKRLHTTIVSVKLV